MFKKYPFYFRGTIILLGLILLVYALIGLRVILVPICFAGMLAVLLNPATTKLIAWGIPKPIAIILSLLVAFMAIALITYFLSSQIVGFSDQLPQFKRKFSQFIVNVQHQLDHRFGINTQKQKQLLDEAETGMKPFLGSTLGTLAGVFGMCILLPVYTFLFLFYKTLLVNFLFEVFAKENSGGVGVVLVQTKKAIQSYMIGLLLEALIVATLNVIALLALGVQYAVLLGILGAVINVLPFVGGIMAVLLPLLIATLTKEGFQAQLGIIGAYTVIQFVDNHFLIPYIVSSRVKINALISIVIVLLGSAVWGIPGMFLSIPFTGILKIIFDQIPEMQPWGKLLGDEIPTRHKGQVWNAVRSKIRRQT